MNIKLRIIFSGLLFRIAVAIILGVLLGNVLHEGIVRVFVTFNGVFSQFLGFMIPLIIVGLVTPAIAEIGRGVGSMLLATVAIAYADTSLAALLGYGVGEWLFPSMVANADAMAGVSQPVDIQPYFSVKIPALLDVMSALVLSFIMGLGISYGNLQSLRNLAAEFKDVVARVIAKAIIPLLPLYIFGIFLNMTSSGQVYRIMVVFAYIIMAIFVLHILILLYSYVVAGAVTRRNPLRLLANMLPAYLTALGTSSSAATIPVTFAQSIRNKVSEGVAGFVIPLCATIHMSGSAMKITCCALTICLLNGMPHDFGIFLHFILMLGIVMVAAPGVPGGCIMAALAPLASILGFDADAQALMIALYIAMDSFGTACNVTGDGAIALVIDKMFGRKDANDKECSN